jgi:cell division protein FtsI (penicillin-binding protein 3)
VVIEPERGNICADDGSLLATSVPGYYVRIDLKSEGVQRVFAKERDSLAFYLSRFFKNVPAFIPVRKCTCKKSQCVKKYC